MGDALTPASTLVAASPRPRVVIADGDPLARRAIRDALELGQSFTVVAEASRSVDALELALFYRPDVVLMEPGLPGAGGLETTRSIVLRVPEVQVVLYSASEDSELELAGLLAGASGFLSKMLAPDAVAQALHGVVRGEAAVSRAATMRLIQSLRLVPEAGRGMRPVRSVLTRREWEVLDLLSSGATTGDIAAALVLSEDTIYSHVKNLMRKLGATTRGEAVRLATQMVHAGRDLGPARR